MPNGNLSPETVSLIAAFTLKLINEFKSTGVVLTEAEITNRFETHYAQALQKNAQLLNDTAPDSDK